MYGDDKYAQDDIFTLSRNYHELPWGTVFKVCQFQKKPFYKNPELVIGYDQLVWVKRTKTCIDC